MIVPEAAQGVQAWDRYAYTNNNPVRFNDPTGHSVPLPAPIFKLNINIPVSNGWDLIAGAACFVLCGFLPVHYEGYGLGYGAIVSDTPQQSADKAILGIAATVGVKPYEVGMSRDLNSRSISGDELDIHHAPQGAPAQSVFPNYNYNDAPAIGLPKEDHLSLNPTNLSSSYAGSPRDLMAKTLSDLRQYTGAPNSALRELVDLVKKVFLGALDKK